MLTARFASALTTAHELHATQLRKGTTIPYISHLLGVSSIALQHGANEDEAIAALLHDAIEDAPRALGAAGVRALLLERFGGRVLRIVEGCTDADVQPKPSWQVRKEQYIAHLAQESDSSVLLVSAADKLHNANAILWDFRAVGHDLWARFNPQAGLAGTVGYYRGLLTVYRAKGHHMRLVDELEAAVNALEEATGHRGVWPL
jgi:(p)ppGpp synthase/HD superfamily hydrolase